MHLCDYLFNKMYLYIEILKMTLFLGINYIKSGHYTIPYVHTRI